MDSQMRGKSLLKKTSSSLKQTVKRLWRAKQQRRKSLAALPIEEKIKIIVKLQQAAYPLLAKRNKNQLKPWKLAR